MLCKLVRRLFASQAPWTWTPPTLAHPNQNATLSQPHVCASARPAFSASTAMGPGTLDPKHSARTITVSFYLSCPFIIARIDADRFDATRRLHVSYLFIPRPSHCCLFLSVLVVSCHLPCVCCLSSVYPASHSFSFSALHVLTRSVLAGRWSFSPAALVDSHLYSSKYQLPSVLADPQVDFDPESRLPLPTQHCVFMSRSDSTEGAAVA